MWRERGPYLEKLKNVSQGSSLKNLPEIFGESQFYKKKISVSKSVLRWNKSASSDSFFRIHVEWRVESNFSKKMNRREDNVLEKLEEWMCIYASL